MAMKYCRNGHEYDDSIYSSCPHCAQMPNRTIPVYGDGGNQGYGATAPLDGYANPAASYGPTAPLDGFGPGSDPFAPAGDNGFAPAGGSGTIPFDDPYAPAGGGYSPYSPGATQPQVRMTEPVNPLNTEDFVDPKDYVTGAYTDKKNAYPKTQPVNFKNKENSQKLVTGWLVCINGPEKGKDYALHENYNKIGRDPGKNDVVITKDPTISRESHAIIAYDSRSNKFFIAPNFQAQSNIYLNGNMIIGQGSLELGDRVEIGESTFLFVPLCGENFKW